MRRVVSYSLSKRGIGHASRLVAVHSGLRDLGWHSLFLVERQQQLIGDYGFDQVSVPHYDDCLVGEAPTGIGDLSGRGARVAARIVAACAEPDDVILHDVVVYRPLYEWARDEGRRQAYISRARKDRDDPVRWLREIAPGITKVFPLGTGEVPDVIRQPLGSKSIWDDTGGAIRVAISAAGGGHADAEAFLEAALGGVARFARDAGREVAVFVVLGPNFTGRMTLPPGIPGKVSITHYLDPWHSLYQGTDLLVCQGGYNTVQELLHHGTAAVTVAGSRPYDDQSARLAAIVAQANVRVAEPAAASIAGHLRALAVAPRRGVAQENPPDGARYIAEALTNWD